MTKVLNYLKQNECNDWLVTILLECMTSSGRLFNPDCMYESKSNSTLMMYNLYSLFSVLNCVGTISHNVDNAS